MLVVRVLHEKIGQPILVHPTVGIDFKVKHIVVNDKRIKLHIWDTGKCFRSRLSGTKLSQLDKKSSTQLQLHTIEVQKVLLLCTMLQGQGSSSWLFFVKEIDFHPFERPITFKNINKWYNLLQEHVRGDVEVAIVSFIESKGCNNFALGREQVRFEV